MNTIFYILVVILCITDFYVVKKQKERINQLEVENTELKMLKED